MKISYKSVNKVMYIGISGELDESSANEVSETLDAIIDKGGIVKVVMDLSAMTFMDSTGIGVLIGRFKKLKGIGVPLVIANPSKVVDKILCLSGIYTLMPKINY